MNIAGVTENLYGIRAKFPHLLSPKFPTCSGQANPKFQIQRADVVQVLLPFCMRGSLNLTYESRSFLKGVISPA